MDSKRFFTKVLGSIEIVSFVFFAIGCNQHLVTPNELMATNIVPTIYPQKLLSTSTSTATYAVIPTSPPQSPSPMPTFLPTLNPEDRNKLILDLIRTNGECKLPCFWGITPGMTTWETAMQFLNHVNVRSSDDVRNDGIHHFSGLELPINNVPINIEFIEQNNIINNINVGMGKLLRDQTSGLDWTPYKLSSILSTYGLPSRVLLGIYQPHEPPGDTTGYELWLIYDQSGILVKYGGSGVKVEPTLLVCPFSAGLGGIDSFVAFFQSSETNQWPQDVIDLMYAARDLETVADLTIEEFYQTYKQQTTSKCIESSESKW